jgi:hypothetical protein
MQIDAGETHPSRTKHASIVKHWGKLPCSDAKLALISKANRRLQFGLSLVEPSRTKRVMIVKK